MKNDLDIMIDHKDLILFIYQRNYKKIKEYIEHHLENTLKNLNEQKHSDVEWNFAIFKNTISQQYICFKKILNSPNPLDKNQTLFEFLSNNFEKFSDKKTLNDNIDLVKYLIENDLVSNPGNINWTRPDGGATLIPSFYKKYKSTAFFTVNPNSYKEAVDILESGTKPSFLYAGCILNLVRCLQQLEAYKANHPNLPENKSKIIGDIITTINQNFENFVSLDTQLREQAGKNIGAVVNDENIKILSYKNDPLLTRILHDVIKILLVYPLLSLIFSSPNFQNSHTPFFHYFGNSFISNIVNEISLTLSVSDVARQACDILKEPPDFDERDYSKFEM